MANEVAVLVNPTSGKGRGARAAGIAIPHLEQAGIRVRRLEGRTYEEAAELAANAVEDGFDALIVVGGDGMVHLACQALAGSELPLGVIPAGTGNDTARSVGIDRKDPRKAANAVIRGHVRVVDLADVAGTRVATVVATGFDAKVNERANQMTWPSGQMRYNLATLAELRVFEPIQFTLELDGQPYDVEAMLVSVGNGPSYGGGLRICEGAEIDDGLLDVVLVKPVSKAELIVMYPRLFNGSHTTHRQFERHRVRKVSIAAPDIVAYGDGERIAPLPLTITALPGALHIFAPLAES
ncbi:MAG TPA: diacylglycerol kinase [Nocardioidaceae bacterium]|nr:diacylglycerol kinase [Nocardioidaceae bacterium]